ncbi:hypothetical protein J2W46_001493 [Paraburkholderia strydomiana]|nr:hypothetical protein [Paraburkholderia strydomiana]
MPTTPLTIIDGAMALPRSRPFNDVPAPFGRGWTLLAPSHRLDKGLHGLYGAVLKTFDLRDQPIRSFCRWVAPNYPITDASAAAMMGLAMGARIPEAVGEHEADALPLRGGLPPGHSVLANSLAAPEASPFQHAFAPVKARVAGPAARAPHLPRWALAGGACALSGAALLAWTAFGHVDVRGPRNGNPTKRTDIAVVERQSPAAQILRRDTVDVSNRVAEIANMSGASAVSVRQHAQTASASGMARTVAPGNLTLHPPTTASIETHRSATIVRTRSPVAVRKDGDRRALYGHRPTADAVNHRRHAVDSASTIATSAPVTRMFVKPSVAGSYSPPVPTQPDTSDYTFVDMSASIRHGSSTQQAQQAPSANLDGSAGQQWSARLTHRRVTEAPDQFIR